MATEKTGDVEFSEPSEAVTAIMNTSTDLEHAVEALHSRGFRKSDVSVLMPVTNGRQNLAFEKKTKAYKGGVIGGVVGIFFGVIISWLALNEIVDVPGAELVADQAPWLVVTAVICLGILFGALSGAVIGFGMPEYVTRLCEKSIRGGSMLIAVHVDNSKWKQRAIDILKFYRARDIAANKKI